MQRYSVPHRNLPMFQDSVDSFVRSVPWVPKTVPITEQQSQEFLGREENTSLILGVGFLYILLMERQIVVDCQRPLLHTTQQRQAHGNREPWSNEILMIVCLQEDAKPHRRT